MGAGAQFVATLEHAYGQGRQYDQEGSDNRQTDKRIDVRLAKETVAEAIDHIKKRVEMRDGLPKWRQRVDRIKHPSQKGQRHNQEILEGSQLIELFRPDTSDQSHRAKNRGPQQGEDNDPPGSNKTQLTDQGRRQRSTVPEIMAFCMSSPS